LLAVVLPERQNAGEFCFDIGHHYHIRGGLDMSANLLKVSVAALVFLSLGLSSSVPAATVTMRQTQLEQYWIGSQWKDSTSDTNGYDGRGLVTSITHTSNIDPNGLISNLLDLNEYDTEKEQTQNLKRSYDKVQGVWKDTISGTKWTRFKNGAKLDTVVEVQVWDAANTRWIKSTRTTYHYTAAGIADTVISSVWDTTGGVGKWLNTERLTMAYNAAGKVTLSLIDGWLKGDSRWLKQLKVSIVYNAGGLKTSDTSAVWDTAALPQAKYVYATLHTYQYNAAGLDTAAIQMNYSKSIDDFLNQTRDTYIYDNNSNQTVWVHYRWTKDAGGIGMWLQVHRETNAYTGASLVATTTTENYDSSKAVWNKALLSAWEYDGSNNATSETFSSWDTSANPDAWKPLRKLNWSYVQLSVGTIVPLASLGLAVPEAAVRINAQQVIVSGLKNLKVDVFSMNGRQIASLAAGKGCLSVAWNYTDERGMPVSTGNYLMRVNGMGNSAVYPITVRR
jgi:hypothetical protein